MSGNTPVETNDAIRHALGYMAAMRSAIRCGESWSDEEFGSVQKVIDRLEAAQSERDQLAAHVERLEKALKPFADRIKQYPPWMWTAMVEREKQGIITGGFRVGGEAVTHMPAMLLVQAEEALAATPAQSLAAHDPAEKEPSAFLPRAAWRVVKEVWVDVAAGRMNARSAIADAALDLRGLLEESGPEPPDEAVGVKRKADRIEQEAAGAKESA